eukprot:1759643-Amphidinium_carterae.1
MRSLGGRRRGVMSQGEVATSPKNDAVLGKPCDCLEFCSRFMGSPKASSQGRASYSKMSDACLAGLKRMFEAMVPGFPQNCLQLPPACEPDVLEFFAPALKASSLSTQPQSVRDGSFRKRETTDIADAGQGGQGLWRARVLWTCKIDGSGWSVGPGGAALQP